MYKIETIILNPLLKNPEDLVSMPKYIDLNIFLNQEISEENIYGIIRLYQGDEQILEIPLDLIEQLWFIIIQLIRQVFEEKHGEWRFPNLLKFEMMNQSELVITNHKEVYVFPRKEIVDCILKGCLDFIEKYKSHTIYIRIYRGTYRGYS